jgi:hypothetical protein
MVGDEARMHWTWHLDSSKRAWLPRAIPPSLLAAGLATMLAAPARADDSPLNTTAGYEYFAGPDGQETQTVTGEVEAKYHRMSATLSAGRVHDIGAGTGWTLGAGLGVPVARRTQLKLNTERTSADSDYVAWKVEAGPAFDFGHDRTLTLTYVRVEDTDQTITNGASAELEGPLVPDHLTASGTLAYTNTGSLNGVEGTAGLSWTPVDHVEIEGDAGYTQTGISLNGPLSSKHVVKGNANRQRGRPGTGTGTSTTTDGTPGMTAQLAVRFSFP